MPIPTGENFSKAALHELRQQLHSGELSANEACARFTMLHLHARSPLRWLSGPRTGTSGEACGGVVEWLENAGVALTHRQRNKLARTRDLRALFHGFYFRGIALDSSEGILAWLENRYPLILRHDVPTPDEMLEAQCQGLRFVSLLIEDEQQFVPWGRHADAFHFMLHDFEHAHKFYGDPLSHSGQVKFFRALRRTLPAFRRWQDDPRFEKDLDYLKADINSHPVHLIKYLKAVTLNAEIRRTGSRAPEMESYWRELFQTWDLPEASIRSALRINQPGEERHEDLVAVADFFIGAREIACGPRALDAR